MAELSAKLKGRIRDLSENGRLGPLGPRILKLRKGLSGARRAMREPLPPRTEEERLFWDPPKRNIAPSPTRAGTVTELLYSKLSDDDLVQMEARLSTEDAELWSAASAEDRRLLAVPFCVHYQVPGVLEKTGLSDKMPPEDVTAQARGSLAAGGSTYYADLVVDALAADGAEFKDGMRVLDFGCSSGRIVRVLNAVYPQVEWHGCDPDGPPIEWSREHLEGIEFFVSEPGPPLPFQDGYLDVVAAVGIWTNFGHDAALSWFDEMHRVIPKGGYLVMTTHGYQSVGVHASDWGSWSRRSIAEIATELYTDGFKFVGAYGKEGHHSLSTPDWGQAFMTPEWVASHVCPRWHICLFQPGCVESNCDLYLLKRQ